MEVNAETYKEAVAKMKALVKAVKIEKRPKMFRRENLKGLMSNGM